MSANKPKLLLQVCCAPCSGLLSRELVKKYEVTVYFDNSNIFPQAEYLKRATEAEKFFTQEGVKFILTEWQHDEWLKLARGLENEPEKGRRCQLCYYYRLNHTAQYASKHDFDFFGTSLSISPWKDAWGIKRIGQDLAQKYDLKFLADDWQTEIGYDVATEFAKSQGFYRQKYCGCEFSIANN